MRLLDRVLGRGRVDRTYDGLRTMMLSVGPEKVVAAANLDRMATAEGPGAPVSGAVRYWALTRAGLRTVGHSSDGPPADAPELQELGGGRVPGLRDGVPPGRRGGARDGPLTAREAA